MISYSLDNSGVVTCTGVEQLMQPSNKKNKPFKAALFELDGALLDRTRSLVSYLYQESDLLFENDPLTQCHYMRRFLALSNSGIHNEAQVYKQLCEEFNIQGYTSSELHSLFLQHFGRYCVEAPHAPLAVIELKRSDFKLGSVSIGDSIFQHEKLKALGIAHYFDEETSAETTISSLDLNTAFNHLAIQPEQAIYISTNQENTIPIANDMGLYTILIASIYSTDCADANWCCSDYRLLVPHIKSISQSVN